MYKKKRGKVFKKSPIGNIWTYSLNTINKLVSRLLYLTCVFQQIFFQNQVKFCKILHQYPLDNIIIIKKL